MKTKALILFLLLIQGLLISCKKEFDNMHDYPFKWAKIGTEFIYDYYTPNQAVPDLRRIKITAYNGDIKDPRFIVYTETDSIDYKCYGCIQKFDQMSIDRFKDGLHTEACAQCGYACLWGYGYLRVPAVPTLGQFIPDYWCKDDLRTNFKVIKIDTVINTELGEIKCFILHDTLYNENEYWSEEIGLIKVEGFDKNNKWLESFVLEKIENAP
jgi:hypothetical protein